MNLRAAILLFVLLFSQAAQGMALWQQNQAACPHDATGSHACCAWLVEEFGEDACGCMKSQEALPVPEPASIPPVSSRDLVPVMAWALAPVYSLSPLASTSEVKVQVSPDFHRALAQPHVRLSVLHCSILI